MIPRTRIAWIGAAALLLAGLAAPGSAAEPVNTGWLGNTAIKGYDPVAYFTTGDPVKGKKRHSTEWKGATWRFHSQAHLEKFVQDPQRYAPAYGGYCAWAVAQGDVADIDPDAWAIHDGRLFLNYSKSIQTKWEINKEDNIRRADRNWPGVLK